MKVQYYLASFGMLVGAVLFFISACTMRLFGSLSLWGFLIGVIMMIGFAIRIEALKAKYQLYTYEDLQHVLKW
ncbi:hypothetical protein [Lactiplantibacillus fabifermentans]|uniref:Uncharacterized protein n=2 Tax=Lactiplantibacillus fabifermentans TaxID=483011 RepID=A0A0R2NL13_9LACO|nr:hypothetical protein [Lactiplantibacillus fabifermentans]ETY73674.1 hypothetical protein LFAB_11185 [Lactiplantibacillus fabifermentans T30PCM01]KRO26463.1 hypothetical protein DY78_GL000928 [Lactiplantibacillus fabifermentans DSM 21115]